MVSEFVKWAKRHHPDAITNPALLSEVDAGGGRDALYRRHGFGMRVNDRGEGLLLPTPVKALPVGASLVPAAPSLPSLRGPTAEPGR